jgi:hypothetical protein
VYTLFEHLQLITERLDGVITACGQSSGQAISMPGPKVDELAVLVLPAWLSPCDIILVFRVVIE